MNLFLNFITLIHKLSYHTVIDFLETNKINNSVIAKFMG